MIASFTAKCTVCGLGSSLCLVRAGSAVPCILHPDSSWYAGSKWKESHLWDVGQIDSVRIDMCPDCIRKSTLDMEMESGATPPSSSHGDQAFDTLVRLDMINPSKSDTVTLRTDMPRWYDALSRIVSETKTQIQSRKTESERRYNPKTHPQEHAQHQKEYAAWSAHAYPISSAAMRRLSWLKAEITKANIAADAAIKAAAVVRKAAAVAQQPRALDMTNKQARQVPLPMEVAEGSYAIYRKITAEAGEETAEWSALSAAKQEGWAGALKFILARAAKAVLLLE